MFHLISFPVTGLIAFFLKKKETKNVEEMVCVFLLALFLHLLLLFLAGSEVIVLAFFPYFTESAFFAFFVLLKIILIIAQSTLIVVELQKKCKELCQPFFSYFPFLDRFHRWLCQIALVK